MTIVVFPADPMHTLVCEFIISHIDYCNTVLYTDAQHSYCYLVDCWFLQKYDT